MQRSYSKRTSCIVEKYPDIGESIENFGQSCNVGADAWRRTVVLMFDGNVKGPEKINLQMNPASPKRKVWQTFFLWNSC